MASVKTAISLDPNLLEQVDTLARKIGISRSQAFASAAQHWVEQHRNEQLLKALNAAYADEPSPEEEQLRQAHRDQHRRLVDGQW